MFFVDVGTNSGPTLGSIIAQNAKKIMALLWGGFHKWASGSGLIPESCKEFSSIENITEIFGVAGCVMSEVEIGREEPEPLGEASSAG